MYNNCNIIFKAVIMYKYCYVGKILPIIKICENEKRKKK